MDVITQAIFGAAAGQATLGRRLPRSAWLAGALGGYLPDADIFITFPGDSLSTWLIHRHFTHGVGFLLVGALLAVLPLLLFASARRSAVPLYLAALAGICTHGVLDSCTSFGTVLYWPFSQRRVGWDLVAIIDPLVSLPLLALLVWSIVRGWHGPRPGTRRIVAIGLVWCAAYIGILGGVQRGRALEVQRLLAQERGHGVERSRVLMAPGQNFVFRSVYEHQGRVWADTIRVPWLGRPTAWRGESTPRLRPGFPPLDALPPAVASDVGRFDAFTQGWTVEHPEDPALLTDARYGVTPDSFLALWSIRLPEPGRGGRVEFVRSMSLARRRAGELLDAILGRDPRLTPVGP